MYKKIISLSVAFVFTFDIFSTNIANANVVNVPINPTDFIVSNNLGTVTSSKYFSSDDIIINIQDLHCHAQTQQQISKILKELQDKYNNITEVYLEGAYENIDTTWLSKLNKNSLGSKVVENLVNTGKLSGVEYYSSINNKNNFIKPIEDQHLYKENISLLNEIINNKKTIEIICEQLEQDIKKLNSVYSNKKSKKLYQIELDFQNNKLTQIQYYNKLFKLARKNNIDLTPYTNIELYIKISEQTKNINKNKLGIELNKFISILKGKISYQDYSNLLSKSNNFQNIDNITQNLIDLDNKYQIITNSKLNNLKLFFDLLNANKKINPMAIVQEEQSIRDVLYTNLGATKYEKYVLFLNDFVPSIKQYFSADISAQDYLNFEQKYKQFRKILPLFFSDNKTIQLDKYNELLSKYHRNNIKRDEIFASKLLTNKNNNVSVEINNIDKSVNNILQEIDRKNVKVVITGGFHTKGLEKILNNNKVSYVIITPKISGDIKTTKQLYLDTIKYNETILKNTINLEPLSQEQINISFPKIMSSVFGLIRTDIFKNLSNIEIKNIIEEFVNENIISVQPSSILKIKSFSITADIQSDQIKYNVVYEQDGTQKHRGKFITDVDYIYSNGQSIPYSKVDKNTVLKTIDAANKKYSVPSVMLEPDSKTRKKIEKYILKPLRDISSPYMEYMDLNQTHMTVAYDPSFNGVSEQEMDEIVELADPNADIFKRTIDLASKNLLYKAYMGGNLRLDSSGVIIYEITDKKLIEEMFSLRKELTSDNKYQTPNIIYMTIGRIMDKSLLEDTPQSREKLAELLKKVNEKIYEINQANELSKIKADFNLKGGYVSSTGNKNYLVTKIKNNRQMLSILKDISKSVSKKVSLMYITVIAPILEEVVFRVLPSLPLLITTAPILSNPILIIPAILTAITGTIIFSYSHALGDKISKQEFIRNWKGFLPRSAVLTTIYLALVIAFPQQVLLAPIVSIVIHSLNNIFVITKKLTILNFSSKDKQIEKDDENIILIRSKVQSLIKSIESYKVYMLSKYMTEEDKQVLSMYEKIQEKLADKLQYLNDNVVDDSLVEIIKDLYECTNSTTLDNRNSINNKISVIYASLDELYQTNLFDEFINSIIEYNKEKRIGNVKLLYGMVEYFMSADQTKYADKILNLLYQNKQYVKYPSDYGSFASPLPSPFQYDSIEKFENEIINIIKASNSSVFEYSNLIDVFLCQKSTDYLQYGYSIIRALYKTGIYNDKPPYLNSRKKGYEWTKEYNKICGIQQENMDNEDIISDVISRLAYIDKFCIEVKNMTNTPFYNQYEEENKIKQKNKDLIKSIINDLGNIKTESKDVQNKELERSLVRLYENINLSISNMDEIISTLAPILLSIKYKDESLLYLFMNDYIEYINKNKSSFINTATIYDILANIYTINKEQALRLIAKVYKDKTSPKTIEEARELIPQELQNVIYDYNDLEQFFYSIGVKFVLLDYQSSIYDVDVYQAEYDKLLKFAPNSVFSIKSTDTKYFTSLKYKQEESNNKSDKTASVLFEAFEELIENNNFALYSLQKLNEDSVYDAIYFVREMIKDFSVISPEYAQKAEQSLVSIENNLKAGKVNIESLGDLKDWSEDGLDKIGELHTLINAVHQISTRLFVSSFDSEHSINTEELTKGSRQTSININGTDVFTIHNCQPTMTNAMRDFLVSFSSFVEQRYIKNDIQIFVNGNKIIYSEKLGIHSVNVMLDLDEGIKVFFNDSGRSDGNALRTILMATLFSQAGFDILDVDSRSEQKYGDNTLPGCCRFSAIHSINGGEEKYGKYAFEFYKALQILGSTKNLDYNIEYNDVDYIKHRYGEYYIPNMTLDDFKSIQSTFDMPKKFKRINGSSEDATKAESAIEHEWASRIKDIKELEKQKEKLINQERKTYDKLYDYLGIKHRNSIWNVVRKYVEGKFVISNKKGKQVLKENIAYNPMQPIINAINTDIDETLRKAQLMNLLNYENMNFVTEGYIGGKIAVSGTLRLDSNTWLSIKAIVDKERSRMKCAYVEKVDFEGNRIELSYDELLKLLKEYGYKVKKQRERNASEKAELVRSLKEDIVYSMNVPYIRGIGVSSVAGSEYVPLQITYNKQNINNNSMWVVAYTTTDDVNAIKNSGGILTTGGGVLSHANITARENEKVAILSNGEWKQDKLTLIYYSTENAPVENNGFITQKITKHQLVLEEGDVVLANGTTGRLLVFKDMPNIEELQNAINNNDIDKLKQLINDNKDKDNIGEIIEYIFFQSISDKSKKKIISMLLQIEEKKISNIITSLFEKYLDTEYTLISNIQNNINKISNNNIKYVILTKALNMLFSMNGDTSSIEKIIKIKKDFNFIYQKLIKNSIKTINDLEKEITDVLKQDTLSIDDKDRLIKLSQQLKVWDYYGNNNIRQLVNQIDERLTQEQNQQMSYEEQIKNLKDISASELLMYGSKTTEVSNVSKIVNSRKNKKVKVPDGCGISKNALEIFFKNAGKLEEYNKLLSEFTQAVQNKNVKLAIEKGKQISQLIENTNDDSLKTYLENMLSDKKYAVRSSGVGEDGGNYAFAGMAKTKLNQSKDNVYASVKECWQSFYTAECIEDMIKQGVIVKPALLVQEMVKNVKKAGVIFTRDSNGNLIIEIVRGLGEGLVSGRIDPDHITIRPGDENIEYIRNTNCKFKIVEQEGGGICIQKLTEEEKIDRIINIEEIKELYEIAMLLEKDAGYPVDIEFAFDENDDMFILQRRPITTFCSQEVFDNGVQLNIAEDGVTIQNKLTLHVEFDDNKEDLDEFVNIQNPLNEEEAITVYLKIVKENNGYSYKFIVDSKYKDIEQQIIERLKERINDDPVIMKKLNSNLSLYNQVKEGEFEILPAIDEIDITEIKQSSDVNIIDVRSMLASA